MANYSCGEAPERAVYTMKYHKEQDETEIYLKADREVISMKTELITCGGRQSLHVISSGEPFSNHGVFEPWGKGHLPSMEESEQLMIWRDKNFKRAMNKVICNTPHKTAGEARRCDAKIPGPNWSGYKPHLMKASRPHKNAIWRSGYYSIPFDPNKEGAPLPVPATSIPSLVKELAKVSQYRRDRQLSHSSNSSDTSSTLDDSQSFRVPAVPPAHNNKEYQVGRSASNPIQIHDEPPSLTEGQQELLDLEDGVEAEASSFSFKLKNPKGIKPLVHDELILRGLGSPYVECRNKANDILCMKQAHRSYTKNQLRRREHKYLDVFRSGKNVPTSKHLQKDLFLPYQPLRDAARVIYLNKNNPDPVATVQIYNKELIDFYRKVQTKKNLQESQKERREAQINKEATPGKTRIGPQIINAVPWDPELWEAVDCEDPHVKMWAEKYHQLLLKRIPKTHPDMELVLRALNRALKDYNGRLRKQVMSENIQLEELKLSKELRDLYLVQQGEQAAGAPEAQLPALQGEQPEATPARFPSPTPISGTPEGTDEEEIPLLVAEAMEDFAPDIMMNKNNLEVPIKQESEQE